MNELRLRAKDHFKHDYSEQKICNGTQLAVDFYFPEEGCIVEIAMSLRNPSSEFERDLLKAVIAQESGHHVKHLLFLSKPRAIAQTSRPGLRAFSEWIERKHNIRVEVREFTAQVEQILEGTGE